MRACSWARPNLAILSNRKLYNLFLYGDNARASLLLFSFFAGQPHPLSHFFFPFITLSNDYNGKGRAPTHIHKNRKKWVRDKNVSCVNFRCRRPPF